ncbi:site-specific integrase [Acidithiobacillus ferrivorans]|nr:site-specific integrase [Acidithiobacillus ferrivorans]
MATFKKREGKKGVRWQAIVRRRGSVDLVQTFGTQKEAEVWARKQEVAIDEGRQPIGRDHAKMTLHDALLRYQEDYTQHKKSAEGERGFIKQWLARPVAKKKLAEVTLRDMSRVKTEMVKEGKGGTTIRLHFAVISNLYNRAKGDWLHLPHLQNPTTGLTLPKVKEGRDRRLNADEMSRLMEVCRQTEAGKLALIVDFAIETCMRQSEIIRIELADIHLDKSMIHLKKTKNEEARDVPISCRAEEIIEECKSLKCKTRAGFLWGYTLGALRTAYKRAVKEAGIVNFDFHDLRHEGISRLYERTTLTDIQISKISGHKTLQVLKRYANLRADNLAVLLRQGEKKWNSSKLK